MAFKVPELHRINAILGSRMKSFFNIHPSIVDAWVKENFKVGGDRSGNFMLPNPRTGKGLFILCRASDLDGWEHVAVSIPSESRCPTWEEMSFVKEMFWNSDKDIVVQFHPAKMDTSSTSQFCLDLWCKKGKNLKTPEALLIGEKNTRFQFLKKFIQSFKKKKK